MLAALTEPPKDQAGWERFAFHNRVSHVAINGALAARGTNLTDPVIFPVDEGDWMGWLERHSLLHQQMNLAIGQQSADLSLLDPKDEGQVTVWINQHWLEHNTLETALGISS